MQQQGVAILAKTDCVAVGVQSAESCLQGPLSSPNLPFVSPTKTASDLLLSLSFDTAKEPSPQLCHCSELGPSPLASAVGTGLGTRGIDPHPPQAGYCKL